MSIYSQFFVPKTIFRAQDIIDLSGKVMLVTGGYSGIGYETTKASAVVVWPLTLDSTTIRNYWLTGRRFTLLDGVKQEQIMQSSSCEKPLGRLMCTFSSWTLRICNQLRRPRRRIWGNSSPSSWIQFIQARTSLETELHVLFNNGYTLNDGFPVGGLKITVSGVMQPPLDQFTAQDYDLQFGTNVLGK